MKCPELSSLSKAPKFSSLRFRRVTPGAIARVWSPTGPRPNKLLANDSKHPSNDLRPRDFPKYVVPKVLTIHAVPFAALARPETLQAAPFINVYKAIPPGERRLLTVSETPLSSAKPYIAPMSVLVAVTNKESRNKPTIKRELGRRLKIALNLLMTRGADTVSHDGQLKLTFDETKAIGSGHHQLLQDWSYIFQPTLEIYRMPYPEIVKLLNTSLQSIWLQAQTLEISWGTSSARTPKKTSPHKDVIKAKKNGMVPGAFKVKTE